MSWLSRLFRSTDRTSAAFERSAVASEQIAAALEACRDSILSRFSLPDAPAPVAAIAATVEPGDEETGKRNGKRKAAAL